jgi:hypothetical protein
VRDAILARSVTERLSNMPIVSSRIGVDQRAAAIVRETPGEFRRALSAPGRVESDYVGPAAARSATRTRRRVADGVRSLAFVWRGREKVKLLC